MIRLAGVACVAASALLAARAVVTPAAIAIHVSVLDSDTGEAVTDLTRDDFRVLTDGQPVPIVEFRRDPGPLTIAVLVDVSRTMTYALAPFTWDGGRDQITGRMTPTGRRPPHRPTDLFLAPIETGLFEVLQSGDRVQCGSIASQVRLSGSFDAAGGRIPERCAETLAVAEAERDGPSPVWDGVVQSIAALRDEPSPRVVIVVTDGMTSGNHWGLRDVMARAIEQQVAVSVIQAQIPGSRAAIVADSSANPWVLPGPVFGRPPKDTLGELTVATGGHHLVIAGPDRDALRDQLRRVVGYVRSSYALGFIPARDGRLHRLDVRVARANVLVRGPSAYRATGGGLP